MIFDASAGYLLSVKDGGPILGIVFVGTPAIVISSLGQFTGLMDIYTYTAFFSWTIYLAMGSIVGYLIEIQD